MGDAAGQPEHAAGVHAVAVDDGVDIELPLNTRAVVTHVADNVWKVPVVAGQWVVVVAG